MIVLIPCLLLLCHREVDLSGFERNVSTAAGWIAAQLHVPIRIKPYSSKFPDLLQSCITELLTPYAPSCNLRSSNQHFLDVVKSRLVTKGDHVFSIRAPGLWYSLTGEIKLYQH